MHIVITGGIGAGKSYVCQRLRSRGIAVYDCDAAAKRLMSKSEPLKQSLRCLVGEEVYLSPTGEVGRHQSATVLNKAFLAQFLLQSEENKQAVNNVVHPVVAADFLASGMEWMESAIYFDSGFNLRMAADYVVCVSAPEDIRVERIMRRDGISREKALAWIHRQMAQEQVERQSDFVIVNDGASDIDVQIEQCLNEMKHQVNVKCNKGTTK